MHKTIRKSLLLIFLAVGAASALSSCSTVRMHENFKERQKEVASLNIVSSEVVIERIVFKGDNEMQFEESKTASEWIKREVETILAKKGYDIEHFELNPAYLEQYPELKTKMSRIKDKYKAVAGDIQNEIYKRMKFGEIKYSIGDEISEIADLVDADLLVFSTAQGFTKSGGEIAKDFTKAVLLGVGTLGNYVHMAPTAGMQMVVSIVDGDNGDILWHNISNPQQKVNPTKFKEIQRMVKFTLNKFPKRVAPEREKLEVIEAAEIDSVEGKEYQFNLDVGQLNTPEISKDLINKARDHSAAQPKSAVKLIDLGEARIKQGRLTHAIHAFKLASKQDKTNPYTHWILGELYKSSDMDKKAIKSFNKSIKLDPSLPDTHQLLGSLLQESGKIKQANKEFTISQSLISNAQAA